jgi:DNA-directed RNA polymerase subunit F
MQQFDEEFVTIVEGLPDVVKSQIADVLPRLKTSVS